MVMSRDMASNFSPYSVLNFGKSYKIKGILLKNKKVTGKKQIGGGKHPPPPVLIGLAYCCSKIITRKCFGISEKTLDLSIP